MRSGIEVYGRGRGAPTRPDESAAVAPTCEFGRTLAEIEATAHDIGRRIGVPVAAVRLGSVLGPHVPSPLGRLLRMPFVPFSVLADPPFAVVEDVECARAFVAAAERRLDEPVNVLANGAITALQAIRRGRRIPIPLIGPEWRLAKRRQRVARGADPRSRARDVAPRPPRRQRPDAGAASASRSAIDHRRGDRQAVRLAVGHPPPGQPGRSPDGRRGRAPHAWPADAGRDGAVAVTAATGRSLSAWDIDDWGRDDTPRPRRRVARPAALDDRSSAASSAPRRRARRVVVVNTRRFR